MAGKHVNVSQTQTGGQPSNFQNEPPVFPGGLLDRAYAEGRQAGRNGIPTGQNPFTGQPAYGFGSEQWNAWNNGNFFNADAAEQIQTAIS